MYIPTRRLRDFLDGEQERGGTTFFLQNTRPGKSKALNAAEANQGRGNDTAETSTPEAEAGNFESQPSGVKQASIC